MGASFTGTRIIISNAIQSLADYPPKVNIGEYAIAIAYLHDFAGTRKL